MPHGGPHQKTTFNSNRPKTDTRPKGIPSFLSSSEPKKSFSQMTSQERTDRFNKNQDKYKKQFEKRNKTIQEKAQTNTYYADRYGYGIPDDSKPRTAEQKNADDRKLYRQYQDPKVIKATEKAKKKSGGFIQDVVDIPLNMVKNYTNRVTNVNKHFGNLLTDAKKQYINPKEPYWQRVLKERALTEWYGTGAFFAGGMEGALGLTLDTAAGYTASTVANFNDIYRALQGLPLSAEIHNDITENLQKEIVGATMAAWESTGYGAMRMPKYPVPSMKATANFIKAKVPFEFKNTVKVFENSVKQKKAKNMTVEGDWKVMTEAATKDATVKKEIKQLAIQSWEQANVNKYGPIMANNIANHLRQVNKIMPVQAQSLSAAATSKTDIYKLGEPFYNPIVQQVNSLPVNEAGQIQVKDLTESLSTKKFERPMVISNFDTFLSNLKESNVTMVDKKTVNSYLKDNPIELTIDIGTSNVPTQLVEEKKFIENSMVGNIGMLQNISTKVSESLPVELTVADIPANMVIEFPSGSSNIGYLNTAHAATGNRLFEEIANTQLQQMKELNYFNPNMLDDFYEGKINLLDAVPYGGFNVNIQPSTTYEGVFNRDLDSQLFEIDISNNNVAQGFKDKIMYSIGYAPHYDTNINYQILNDFSSNGKIRTAYIPIKKSAEANAIGEQWVSQLLTNFNNRDHFNADTGEYQSSVPEFMLSVPNTKSLTLDVKLPNYGTLQNLKELANPKNILNQDALMDLTSNNRLVGEYYKEANSNALVNDDYYANQRILQSFLYQLVERLELRDLPGWAPYINKLTQPPDFSKITPQERRLYVAQTTAGMTTIGNWQYHLNNLKNKYANLNSVNKKIEVAEKEKIVDTKRPYITTPVDPKGYEFANNVLTFDKHPHGKYMEVKLTSNDLSGYPEFGDEHFRNTKNLLGWSIVTDRRVNISPINPKGERAYVIEEIQPTRPDATMSSNKENAIEGTFLFGSMTKKGLGKPDWYKKKLWADIRVAYDNGFDYLIIPTTKSIKSKTGSGGFYDELPNVAKKFGFDTIKNADMAEYGFTAPPSVIEQRLRDKEDSQIGVDDDFGPYGQEEINIEFLNENYGDHKFHIIDIRDRNKVFDILNKPQPVAKLIDQTNQMLSTFV